MSLFLQRLALFLIGCLWLAGADGAAIQAALAALGRGDFAAAEQVLRPEVKARPNDAAALTLLGVALDGEKNLEEAEAVHLRAVASAPNSADAWNNYANHLIATGDESGAGAAYLRVLALDPGNANANIQLARLAVKAGKGAAALGYLGHLPAGRREAANLAPLRLAALYLAGSNAEAANLAARWLETAKGDLAANFAFGVALADAGAFRQAALFFTHALALAPADFHTLFNLGVVAYRTGDYDRAREVLEAAQRQQPENTDVLYNLACVEHAAARNESAAALLVKAARLAPERADIRKLLATAVADLGALDDAAAQWDLYLKLQPSDDVGRRERGFIAFQRGLYEQGLADVAWYVQRHPDDPAGHFELGEIQMAEDPARALAEYGRALALKPDYAAAFSERGSLYYQMGKPEAALSDLEAAVALRPRDAVSLDRLGQTYLALDRAGDAVRVLRQAVTLAPDQSKMQLHLARALAQNGQTAESSAALDRFRQLGPAVSRAIPPGFVEYLSLTPDQRRADYRRRLERVVREHPDDAAGQIDYLKLLLEDGDFAQAAESARQLAALHPPVALLTAAVRALLDTGQYGPARDLLEKTAGPAPPAELEVDLAAAVFHLSGPAQAIELLARVPDSQRDGNFYLSRAEIWDAAGKIKDATADLEQALRASPGQPAIYFRACLWLLRRGRVEEALQASQDGTKAVPGDRQILLVRAAALHEAGRSAEAHGILLEIENRWPEWAPPWAADGIVLGVQGRSQEAIAALHTAVALGFNNAEVKHYLEELPANSKAAPPNMMVALSTSSGAK